jgi:signal transduction histidine kinase
MPSAYLRGATYLAITMLGLAIGLWGLSRLPRLSELPPAALESVSYPAWIQGVAAGSPAELRFLAEARPPGSVVTITSARGSLETRLRPQINRLHFLLIAFEGMVFFAVNLLVFLPRLVARPAGRGASTGPVRDLYWGTLIYAALTMINGIYFPRTPVWTERVMPLVTIAGLTFLPLCFLRLALTFPRRAPVLDRNPKALRWLVIVAGVLIAWQGWAYLSYFAAPSPARWGAIQISQLLGRVFLVLVVAASCFLLYRRARRLELSRERSQVRWILWGITIGITPYVFLRTIPRLFGGIPPLPPEVDRVFELAIPLAFAVAVVRHQFLNIDLIIRRSLIYGILTATLTVVYLVLSEIVATRLTSNAPQYTTALRLLAVAVPVALFTPARHWIGGWIDRTVFKIQYDYARSLTSFRDDLRGATTSEEIAERLESFLGDQLQLSNVRVVSFGSEGRASCDGSEPAACAARDALIRAGRSLVAKPGATSRPELEVLSANDDSETDPRIVLALGPREDPTGLALLGSKVSERRFVDEDLQLLDGSREIASAALERVALVTRAAEEALERRKVEEMERFRHELFSRVAHDLRTPCTSIRLTVQNLIDGVAGAPNPDHAAHLTSIQGAADQLGRLANNLLEADRMERPSPPPAPQPIDLASVIESAVALLRPTATSLEVRLAFDAPTGLPPVDGIRDSLDAVLANLIENAIRYSPKRSEVEIVLERNGSRQCFSVRDHGPGIADEDMDRIFGRFGRGRPSPYSSQRGFGLGLYVAKSHIENMGGGISAGNHPGGGARFICMLNESPSSRSVS